MSKHTPGPWRVDERYRIVRDTLGSCLRVIVETTISGECDVDATGADNTDQANARLIAAAPDLLAACEAIRGPWFCKRAGCRLGLDENKPNKWTHTNRCKQLRAAIAKAKEGTQ